MSKPTYNFGEATLGGSAARFGQASNANQTSSFTSNTPASNPFGGASNTQQVGAFGGTTQPLTSGSLFGSLSATAGPQKPMTFGANTTSNPASGTSTPTTFGVSTGNFSGGQTNSFFGGGGGPTGSPITFGSGSGLSFGQKPEGKNENTTPVAGTPQQQKLLPFGGGGMATGASSFGGAAALSAPAGSTTPATKPGNSFNNFGNSTTPAGPPPADNATGTKPAGIAAFGSAQPPAGGYFGSQKPADSVTKPTTSQPIISFGGNATSGAPSSTFGAKPAAPASASNPFASMITIKPAASESVAAALSTPSTSAPKAAFGLTTNVSSAAPSAIAQAPSFFGAASSAAPASSTAAPVQTQTKSFFGGLANTTTSSSSQAPGQAASSFSGLSKPGIAPSLGTSSTPGATTSAPVPTLSVPKTTETTSGTTPASNAPQASIIATAGAASLGASTTGPLGASTAGPAPQLSRLKNKTMDEIITRWATDLSTYQKEFQNQAAKVASWDRLLVENGDKIQKLYTSTFEAERASAEVERQLSSVESQQDELTAWLDHYEREVNEMFAKQVGPGESLQGPDQERERTYKLAEKLTDRLDEMGKDLTSMIEEINNVSATLTKTSKPDDPLSQIVRVLNGHLSQLQWIDQNAAALQAKVAAAQKAGQSIAARGSGGPENDSVDDFYRSYMGRR